MGATVLREEMNYANFSYLGSQMQSMGMELIDADNKKVVSYWFQASEDANLYFWMDLKGNLIKQSLGVYGLMVEWNIVEGIKTGAIVSDESSGADDIRYDIIPNPVCIEQAIQMIQSIKTLNPGQQQRLVGNLRSNVNASKMNPREFLRLYGGAAKVNSKKSSIWASMRKAFARLFDL